MFVTWDGTNVTVRMYLKKIWTELLTETDNLMIMWRTKAEKEMQKAWDLL